MYTERTAGDLNTTIIYYPIFAMQADFKFQIYPNYIKIDPIEYDIYYEPGYYSFRIETVEKQKVDTRLTRSRKPIKMKVYAPMPSDTEN